ncbi:hypothetical protein Patl1_00793 [Pistacia atlantica]|uniref:Uncharacterized protein n=1 Tax=Pistacia atlantica TaxID=434234 RepID=A0ACC1CC17_9ROSI|nr:hypothetical protein Patl1_00793 [Pistacia atlantica]
MELVGLLINKVKLIQIKPNHLMRAIQFHLPTHKSPPLQDITEMHGDEARVLLGFPPNYRPTLSQVKAAYRRKVWESHPDLFPLDKKPHAESKFKLISEAYTCLLSGMAPLRSTGYVDPGWEHGIAQDERKKKVKCNYCGKIVSGGIFRLKQHLARISGEVTHCERVPDEVCLNMRKNLEGCRSGRKRRQSEYEQPSFSCHSSDYNDTEDTLADYKHKGKKVMGDKNLVIRFAPLRSLGYVDPGWEHCVAQDDKKKRVKCNYCEKIISGGINRFKQHLARIPGEVAYCEKAPEDVYLKIKENMKWHRTGRRHRKPDTKEISAFYMHSDNEDEEEEQDGRFLQCVGKDIVAIDDNVSDSDIRYNVKGRSPSSSGNGAEPLMRRSRLDSVFLKTLRNQTSPHRKQVKAKTGFEKRTRKEVISAICKFFYHAGIPSNAANSPYFHKMLELVITKSTASFKTAGKMLEEKRRNLFWTPCAVYCIDRMLEDILSIKWVGDCLDKAKKITRLIYNSTWLLSFMKKEFTKGQELLRPATTKFATNFLTLESLLEQRTGLKRMFQSNKWLSSRFAKSDEGKDMEKNVLNATFWKKMQYVKKSLEPVAEVLQKIDSDASRSISCIYNDMCRAKFAIKAIHGDDVRKYGPFWNVIDNQWNLLFHHPLHVAAYFFNPSYRCHPDFIMNPEIIRGLNECIVRLEADNGKRISASMQIPDFVSARADFGTDLAISTRTELDPAAWWQQHGISCLELQRIAIRILSQTCSSVGCEHTWSTYDQIHCKRRNCLSRKRWNDLTYVHYNVRLREHQMGRKFDDVISFDNTMLENILDDWLVESEKQSVQEDEEILYNEMEQFYGDEIDENENEERRPAEMVTLAGLVEPLEINPAAGGVTTDDDVLDFFDDDLTD